MAHGKVNNRRSSYSRWLAWLIVVAVGVMVECGCSTGTTASTEATIQKQDWTPSPAERTYLDLLKAQDGYAASTAVTMPWQEDDHTLVAKGYAICADLPYAGWAAGSRPEAERLTSSGESRYPILQTLWLINVAEDALCSTQVKTEPSDDTSVLSFAEQKFVAITGPHFPNVSPPQLLQYLRQTCVMLRNGITTNDVVKYLADHMGSSMGMAGNFMDGAMEADCPNLTIDAHGVAH